MSQPPITQQQVRETIVNEAIARATRESAFLFIYEYKHTIFETIVWATLTEGEPIPEDSRLLCTVNQAGQVDWKIDELIQTPIARTALPSLSDIKLPIEEVQFNSITVTIAATDPATAYALLCQALATIGCEYATNTFQTHGAAGESEEQSTTNLFPHPSAETAHTQPPSTTQKTMLAFIVEFCSERLEWFCGENLYRDSAEVVWLENARQLLDYPPLDFSDINFAEA